MSDSQNAKGRVTLSSVVRYVGAVLVAISAICLFLPEAVASISPGKFFVTSALSTAVLALFAITLRNRAGNAYDKPAGIFVTLAVMMIPVTLTIGLIAFDLKIDLLNASLVIELATVLAGLVALLCFRFPFTAVPVIVALWAMSMTVTKGDLAAYDLGDSFSIYLWVTVAFGTILSAVSLVLDMRAKENYSFWGYLFGASAIWWGLTCLDYDSEVGRFLYFAINVFMVIFSVAINRRVFVVYGIWGALAYIFHVTYKFCGSGIEFAVALALEGVALILLAIVCQKNPSLVDGIFAKILGKRFRVERD
jgi:hypothetical protein